MRKRVIAYTVLFFTCMSVWAQKEYRVAKNSGKLVLHLNGAVIEGYDGNEIIFSSQNAKEEEVDERAKGLQVVSGSGYTDNTGLGVNVTVNGQNVEANIVGRNRDQGVLKILVPKQLSVQVAYNKTLYAEPIVISNMNGEIEVSVSYNGVKLENNTGPMNVKTLYKGVDASFDHDIKGPISIVSVYDYVDVALPVAAKGNVELGTSYGKIYAADDFKLVLKKKEASNEDDEEQSTTVSGTRAVSSRRSSATTTITSSGDGQNFVRNIAIVGGRSETIKGTINGGGPDLILKSTYKNVYLRTK